MRTESNSIVLSDGDGNVRYAYADWDLNDYPYHRFKAATAGQIAMNIQHTTSSASVYGLSVQFTAVSPNNGTAYFHNCSDGGGTARFRVTSDGSVGSGNNNFYNLSDIKLKENIVDSGSQWDDIKAVKVKKYSYKEAELDAPNMIGVVAQDLEEAGMNGLVMEAPDFNDKNEVVGTSKAVKYSILYMKAIKALQEAMTRIETLETKVAALEAE